MDVNYILIKGNHLAGVHIYLNGDQFIVPGLPEFGVHQGLPVLTPGQVVEQAAREAILIAVHFDVLGLDQLADLRVADVGAVRLGAAAGYLFPLLHAEEREHRRTQLWTGRQRRSEEAGCRQYRRQQSIHYPADRNIKFLSFALLHNTLF